MHDKIRGIHMIGIGGSGMSGIAEVLLNLGYVVSGSDITASATTKRLEEQGAKIFIGHHAQNIKKPHVVVRSTAVDNNNPEILTAKSLNIPIISRAEMLAELMRLRSGVAIAGTHGKTTTTSLIASVFDAAKEDPTVIIGGLINAYGANARLGSGKYLIAEADESDGSFLCLSPIINVVTNIDYDHIDYFHNQENIDEAFIQYMNKIPFYGLNVICGDDKGCKRVLPHIKRPYITYGFEEDNTLRAEIIHAGEYSHFRVYFKKRDDNQSSHEELWGEVHLAHPGLHNILNALATIGVGIEVGLSKEAILKGLAEFKGVGRRYEKKGSINGIDIIDDYGHHPVEIAATIACAKQMFPTRKLVMAFQPHRFSRTQLLFGDFCKCFEGVDKLYLAEIYAASETPIPGITGQALAQGIRQISPVEVEYIEKLSDLEVELIKDLESGDVLLTQGAGSITHIGPRILNALQK